MSCIMYRGDVSGNLRVGLYVLTATKPTKKYGVEASDQKHTLVIFHADIAGAIPAGAWKLVKQAILKSISSFALQ